MTYPDGGKVIDLMFGLPDPKGLHAAYESFKPLYRDRESRDFAFPAQYMFKEIPDIRNIKDPMGWVVEQMDKHKIERALTGWSDGTGMHEEARRRFPERFAFMTATDPNWGTDEVRRIKRLVKEN